MAFYLPIRALNRSAAVRIDSQLISPTVTAYVDISKASVRKELAYHAAFTQWYVVGTPTASNVDSVVDYGGVVTAGTGLKVLVTAGEILKRSTGAYVAGAADPGSGGLALTAAHATLDRTDLVHWDATSGALAKTDGATAAAGTSVAPATPAGKVPLATVLVAATVTVPGAITDVRPRT